MPSRPTITRREIERGLRDAGLVQGDIVLLHSSVWSLGAVEGGPQTVVDAFLTVLGDSGTLAVPAFGELGIVSHIVREDPRAVQSLQHLGRISAIGPHAEQICHDHHKAVTAHGDHTPYTRIADLGGYVCLLGVDQDRNTTLHSVEALLKLPFLHDEPFEFELADGTTQTGTFKHFPGPHRDFIGLDRRMREAGVVKVVRIGRAAVRLMKTRALIDFCVELGQRDPAFILCDNPNCAACVSQHATIRQSQLESEPFTLSASSALAGRYVPEIIENLNNSGLKHVELDLLQGIPVQKASETAIRSAVEQLNDSGISVSAVRCTTLPADPEPLCKLADELHIPRLIMPLSADAEAPIDVARSRGLDVSLCNVIHAGSAVRKLLRSMDGIHLTFSPCGFARCGEHPFLGSLNTSKARRTIDQLDIEDCLFDGTPTALGRGNAEIKELVSILRCGGFGGTFVLSRNNRVVGDLREIARQFDWILDTICNRARATD